MPDLSGLQRQRRFLILMSLAVIAYYFLGATPNERAEYSGFGVTLANPQGVLTGLWVVWGWALWRYVQCIYERLSEIHKELIEDVEAEDQRIAFAHALRYARRLARKGHFNTDGRTNAIAVRLRPSVAARAAKSGEAGVRNPHFSWTKTGGRKYDRLELYLQWGSAAEPGGGSQAFQVEMSPLAAKWLRARAWFYAIIGLPAFSEYAAPLLLACAVPFAVLLLGPDTLQQVSTESIDRFWRVYSETDLIAFDGEPKDLDVTPDLRALSAALRSD